MLQAQLSVCAQETSFPLAPQIQISNRDLLQGNLSPNETFTAGDFPVTVLAADGSNGTYSGSGYVQVPYLGDAKLVVVFKNIKINTDRQLIEGVVETTYDVKETAITSTQEIVQTISDFGSIIENIEQFFENLLNGNFDNATQEEKENALNQYSSNIDSISSEIDQLLEMEDITDEQKTELQQIKQNLEESKSCVEEGLNCENAVASHTEEPTHGPSPGNSYLFEASSCETQRKNCKENVLDASNRLENAKQEIETNQKLCNRIA
ncbi:hypothetical protein FACS189429_7460 [Bacteroidia bacterium]|nr:hypothetical protein FACS189429_7460 [Bacteroidia bacterium]